MKKINKYLYSVSVAAASLLILPSCTDYLDKAPESEISEEEAFKNFKNFQGFVEELYFCVPDFVKGYWNNSFNWGDDEIINVGVDYMMGYKIDQGDFWGWQSEHDGWQCGFMDLATFGTVVNGVDNRPSLWKGAWYGIRKCNLGLANLDRLTEATQEQKDIIEGQLLFFRGWFHFQLMQYFGGLPYIDEVLAGGKLTLPRLSYHETADHAAADLRRAANLLPINWDETATGSATKGNNDLRANKIMALGYLGKNLLWAGSPLMNKESTGSTSYNADYCKQAAEAFGELLSLVESGRTQYALVDFANYKDIFLSMEKGGNMPGSTEAIFRTPCTDWNRTNWGQSKDYGSQPITSNGILFMPCANYVNFYGMANGLPLDDPDSGFDKSHPWKDRDPRFYHDIKFDGCKLEMGGNKAADPYRYAPLYTDSPMRDPVQGTRTGYLNYKFVDVTFNQWDLGWDWGHHTNIGVPWMRLSDIYLMYAEAAANASGTPMGKSSNCGLSAVDAVNTIRNRAGVAELNSKYTGGMEPFMSELRRERAVELAFEAHRFNDLRRWLLLDKAPYITKTSIEFQRAAGYDPSDSSVGVNIEDPSQNEVIGYHEEEILTRNYSEKHYWLPLKVNDTKMYVEFGQNPGW
ncbi:MAG: RagB/SusD family nutrient uptake outer membrane protein [Muribaculaceae bacterium]|nr:RagB/SusD family nutrient uptake outer membrane protein [Muribaculaceae bacterium]